uniref:ATP synthase CF1 delta subunit n=1 Tax=Astrosyne radiata TaxID=1158023 RepID=A0A2U9NTV2_9STRA|nr:ATP synthase CF1 delta subunit [Astrosyne radiata]AWT40316.1 ATP synthase CF1 delta subunit [Astrosyne radiata]
MKKLKNFATRVSSNTDKACKYATAIYIQAYKAGIVHLITQDILFLDWLFRKNPWILDFLTDPTISKIDKIKKIYHAFKKILDPKSLYFLEFIIQLNASNLLLAILHQFLNIVLIRVQLDPIDCTVADRPTKFFKNKLLRNLSFGSKKVFSYIQTNPILMIGLLVLTRTKVFNMSFKNKIMILAGFLGLRSL